MNRRFFLLGGLAVLSACATAPIQVARPRDAELGELEGLYAVHTGRHGLTISVVSRGCTRREDFAVFSEPAGEAVSLSFARRRVETCPTGSRTRSQILFGWHELSLTPGQRFYVRNPIRR
jgi:hypothetical protein